MRIATRPSGERASSGRAVRLGAACGRLNFGVSDAHPPALAAAQMAGMSITVSGTVAGEDMRHLQRAVHTQAQMAASPRDQQREGAGRAANASSRRVHGRPSSPVGHGRATQDDADIGAGFGCVPKQWRSV